MKGKCAPVVNTQAARASRPETRGARDAAVRTRKRIEAHDDNCFQMVYFVLFFVEIRKVQNT